MVARLLDLPHFPLTATFLWLGPLGLVPLPRKWYREFGEPIDSGRFSATGAGDPDEGDNPADRAVDLELSDEVRDRIQTTLHRLRAQRRSIWR